MLGSVGKPPPQSYWMPPWAVAKVGLYWRMTTKTLLWRVGAPAETRLVVQNPSGNYEIEERGSKNTKTRGAQFKIKNYP